MKVCIIGGGASGLVAAITAAERGNEVTLYERQARVGRKLMSTGNGRCNLTNMGCAPEHYHGADVAFIRPALDAFGAEEAREFFSDLGLITVAEPSGRVYPFSDQAGSVLDVLRFRCDALGVATRTGAEVRRIRKRADGFMVETGEEKALLDRAIIACGGAAGAKVGGVSLGYELLRGLGHRITELRPALVQIKTDAKYIKSLKGVRAQAGVGLRKDGKTIVTGAGEVQFTEYGLSGPAIFDISRWASEGCEIRLDLAPDMGKKELIDYLRQRAAELPELTAEDILTGFLHNRLGSTAVRYAGISLNTKLSSVGFSDILKIADAVKGFAAEVYGTLGFDSAQVTCGGADTKEFKPETLESRIVPGLYACGEVLDVDGDCGGYNLAWAWASGRRAGELR
ncbi:MAG: NAD(P)/FAD-dependent oxidoreductase [Oscillospiraceae bacterium]|nr:NAD(P)/FAD-dependent oxidoreductase [Oscillospiraceae bacterium]